VTCDIISSRILQFFVTRFRRFRWQPWWWARASSLAYWITIQRWDG